ncbi:MAG: hypothetical protein QME58_07460 [Bacteroidota bacterium]|nr:hypothetical protein [Bacteroidota bacterium]
MNKDVEKSCLVLGFYLARWGMFRGSSFLLQHSVKHLRIYKEIKERLILNGNKDLTLITKVLLGVFGFIPAFDTYFCDTFRAISKGQCGFRKVNNISLGFIHNFYQENKH